MKSLPLLSIILLIFFTPVLRAAEQTEAAPAFAKPSVSLRRTAAPYLWFTLAGSESGIYTAIPFGTVVKILAGSGNAVSYRISMKS
jgi:hypothetical protein